MVVFEACVNLSPFLALDRSFPEALQWAQKQLTQAGLRPVQTFDLNTARAGAHDCYCLHHETQLCDCQMVVVLVYGNAMEPVTLIVHGNNGQTWLSIAEAAQSGANPVLTTAIRQALDGNATK